MLLFEFYCVLVLLVFTGILFLALSQPQHQSELKHLPFASLIGKSDHYRRIYRGLAITLLLAGLLVALPVLSVGTASVMWFGLLAVNTWLVALLLSWHPTILTRLAEGCFVLICCSLFVVDYTFL